MQNSRSLGRSRAFLLAAVFLSSCRRNETVRVGEPGEESVIVATQAVDRFHAGIKAERYNDVCQSIEDGALRNITALPCAEFLAYLRGKLGVPTDAKHVQLPIVDAHPKGATVRVAMDVETLYEHGATREHFEWRASRAKVSLMSYSVRADALK